MTEREKPILMSAPMVRAILAGTKTMTRRLVKLPHQNPLGRWEPTTFGGPSGGRTRDGETIPEHAAIWHTRTGEIICARWVVGDRLWVREAWRTEREFDRLPPRDLSPASPVQYEAGPFAEVLDGKLRPSMFMPRWASRITLEVTGVRVERLQDISEADAVAEGIDLQPRLAVYSKDGGCKWEPANPIQVFCDLWESLNGPGSWDANPWVWVVEFRRLERAS
jgi:hypothetical protein